MKLIIKFLFRLVIAIIIVSSIFIITQDLQIFPGAGISIFKTERSPGSIPSDVKARWITTEDGERIEVWQVESKAASPIPDKKIVAILFHGNAETVDTFYNVQAWLSNLGISSYSYDYRGYGHSTGWPTEQGLYMDVDALLREIKAEIDTSNTKIIILGSSIGSGIAAYAATKFTPDILLLLAPYSSLKDVVEEVPLFGLLSGFLFYELPTSRYIRDFDRTCVIAVHGSDDTIINPINTERLWRDFKLKENFNKIIMPDTHHNNLLSNGFSKIEDAIFKCLKIN